MPGSAVVIPDLSTASPIRTCPLRLALEIVIARDDRAFLHRRVGGNHQTSNVKISVLRKDYPKQILSVLPTRKDECAAFSCK